MFLVIVAGAFIIVGIRYCTISKRLHPAIKKHYVISLEVSDIKRKADTGIPFSITLGEKQVEVSVKPTPTFTEDVKIIEWTKGKVIQREIKDTINYSGYVVGSEKTSGVRFTISKNLLIGSVQLDEERWYIEPLRKFQADAGKNDYIVYRTKDLKFRIDFGKDTPDKTKKSGFYKEDKSSLNTDFVAAFTQSFANKRSNRMCITLVADRELLNWLDEVALVDWRESPELFLLALLNDVNGIYEHEIGYHFEATHILFDIDNNFLTSTDKDALLNQFRTFITDQLGDLSQQRMRIILRTEVAHLLTGKEIDGNTIGYANNPGRYGFTQVSFHHVQGYRFPLFYQNMLVMAHELGHNFNGVHNEADEWCVTHFIWCWDYVRSLMWETCYDDNEDEFSDGSRNTAHNNLRRIENNWEGRIGSCDAPIIENPGITSPTHIKGQTSCERVLTVEWETPNATLGVGGYSYTIVSQDDPYYDINRTPDETIDLDASVTSFTTPPLEPGHIWEFNIITIDDLGFPGRFYSSFWVDIESCSVEIWVIPREGAIFEIGEWENFYYSPATYGGEDVSGCYNVSLALMKGTDVVLNIGSNLPYTLSYGFWVPDVEPGSDYYIRIILERESICDTYSYLPETLMGLSNNFSITRP